MKLTNALTFGLLALLATTAFVGPAAADTTGATAAGSADVTAPEYDPSTEGSVDISAGDDDLIVAEDSAAANSSEADDASDVRAGDEIVADYDGANGTAKAVPVNAP